MLFRRPLLFLSLPGLALVLGLVWYRRKRSIHCDTGGDKNKRDIKFNNIEHKNNISTDNNKKIRHSNSLPIESSKTDLLQENNTRLGKSAPIDIIPNLRSPPFNKSERIAIDPEELTSKIKDSEYKTLRSIEEQEDFDLISPIDLPDSVEQKRFFYSPETRHIEILEPVVIKATMPAKISPTNSFAETKYTDKCSDDDERDSANHSPVQEINDNDNNIKTGNEEILEKIENINIEADEELSKEARNPPVSSPPLSECSLHSNDSGKGSSPPHSIGGTPPNTYEFLLPQNLVGQIIGRKGTYVNQIKSKTGASVLVKKHPESNKMKICSIQGTQKEIDDAVKMIRQKLPESRYPNLTMARVYFTTPQTVIPLPAIDTTCLRLQLIEGINNDVIVSAIMSGGHVFFQQPLHPSFPSLNILQSLISQSYSIEESPALPEIKEDAICVAPINGAWFRVQIISYNPETQSCLVKYLDYGGYTSLLGTELRQIRTDFMTVSFQAIECLLSNIRPIGGTEWVPEAATVLQQLTKGIILQAQVAGYSTDGLPEVFLYACIAPDNVIFINQELVARGLAEWVEE